MIHPGERAERRDMEQRKLPLIGKLTRSLTGAAANLYGGCLFLGHVTATML